MHRTAFICNNGSQGPNQHTVFANPNLENRFLRMDGTMAGFRRPKAFAHRCDQNAQVRTPGSPVLLCPIPHQL